MTTRGIEPKLLPDTAQILGGRLSIAGCDVETLAHRFGTPLFIYDEEHIRSRCREAVDAFGPNVAYASKAFFCVAMAKLAHEEGMQIDVSTGGELYVAIAAGVPAHRLVFHGNNKSLAELEVALEAGVGRLVVDSWNEIERIESLVVSTEWKPSVLIRVNPGVEAHTHEYLQTGVTDSKFGFPLLGGEAQAAIDHVRDSSAMTFRGVHAHIGSQVFDIGSFARAIDALAPFVKRSGAPEFSVGGGLGVAYVHGERSLSITEWADEIHHAVSGAGIDAEILAEPGRSVIAASAVTAYTVGTIKEVPGVRMYVSVDGGMSDNPRPVLYGSGYEVFRAIDADADRTASAHIVGKHCEAGDVIVRDGQIPDDLVVGDVLCTPVTGAYGHSMGSNYNKVLRPAVVFVRDGESRLVVERETYEDLIRRDLK